MFVCVRIFGLDFVQVLGSFLLYSILLDWIELDWAELFKVNNIYISNSLANNFDSNKILHFHSGCQRIESENIALIESWPFLLCQPASQPASQKSWRKMLLVLVCLCKYLTRKLFQLWNFAAPILANTSQKPTTAIERQVAATSPPPKLPVMSRVGLYT